MKVYKVLKQSEVNQVDSQKSESGKISKCSILLQEMGGKYENQFIAVMLGNMATLKFYEGDVVVAKLRFQTHDHGEQTYQDILVQEIIKLK